MPLDPTHSTRTRRAFYGTMNAPLRPCADYRTMPYRMQGAIQANHPVPAHADIYYYEVLVLDGGLSGKIAVGFADKSFKVTRQPG